MLTAILTALTIQGPALVCPVAGDEISDSSTHYEYAGLSTAICCAGCEGPLKKDTEKVLTAKGTGLVAFSLYDVVSKQAVKANKAAAYADVDRIRYYFQSKENKDTFLKDPKKFTARPKLEAFGKCIVTEEVVPAGKLAAYRDIEVMNEGKKVTARVYFCCLGCVPKFDAAPDKFSGKAKFAPVAIHEIKN